MRVHFLSYQHYLKFEQLIFKMSQVKTCDIYYLTEIFEEEVASAIDTFLQYIESNRQFINTGHLVRHMLALVFPTIIVTVARTVGALPFVVRART